MKAKTSVLIIISSLFMGCGGNGASDQSSLPVDPQPLSPLLQNQGNTNAPAQPDILHPAPMAPNAEEQRKIDAGKVVSHRYDITLNIPIRQDYILNGHRIFSNIYDNKGNYARTDARTLPQGFAQSVIEVVYPELGYRTFGTLRSYQGKRSGIMLMHHDLDTTSTVFGYQTPIIQLPSTGKTTYRGIAFDLTQQGILTYHLDFARKTGHGTIEGFDQYGTITLNPATYQQKYDDVRQKFDYVNYGTAQSRHGTFSGYSSRLAGERAEEIVGGVAGIANVVFHGTRGSITAQ